MIVISRQCLVAFLLPAAFWLACSGESPPADPASTQPIESRSALKTNAWKNYQTMWSRIDALKEGREAETLYGKIDALESGLDALFPKDAALVNDLLMILRDKLSVKEQMLRDQRGRPPKPDWANLLKRSSNRLAAELRVVERFSAMAIADSWTTDMLVHDMALYAQIVAQGIDDLQSHTPPAARTDAIRMLLEDAGDTLQRALLALAEMGR